MGRWLGKRAHSSTVEARGGTLEHVGRVFAVLIPIAVGQAVSGRHSAIDAVTVIAVLGLIWYSCVDLSFVAHRTTLATLGPSLPVLEGTLLALVVSTAAGVWVHALALGTGTNVAIAAAVFVAVAGWDAIVARYLATPTRLLLVGPIEACLNVISELRGENGKRFELVGVIDDRAPGTTSTRSCWERRPRSGRSSRRCARS